MTWNYRIVEYACGTGFGIHEVYYNAAGKEVSMTEQPAVFVGEEPEEVRGSLMMAKMDAHRRPIFKEPDDWLEDES